MAGEEPRKVLASLVPVRLGTAAALQRRLQPSSAVVVTTDGVLHPAIRLGLPPGSQKMMAIPSLLNGALTTTRETETKTSSTTAATVEEPTPEPILARVPKQLILVDATLRAGLPNSPGLLP